MVVAIGRLRDDKESFLINMNQARKPYALSTLITNGANAPAGPEVGPFDVSNEDLPQYPIFVSGITFPLGTDPTKFFFEYTSPFSPPDRRGGLIAALDFQPALPSEAVDSIDTFATPDYATRAESTDNRFTQSSDGLIAKAAVKTMQKLLPVNEVVVGESSGWSDNRLTVVMTNLDGSACGAKSCAAIKLQYQYTSLFTPRTIERQVVMLNQIDQSN
jgi:hypothetical protein